MILRSQSSSVFTVSSTVIDNHTFKSHRRQLQLLDYGDGCGHGQFHVRVSKILLSTTAVTVGSSGGSLARRKSRNRFINVRSSASASDLSSSTQSQQDITTPGSGPDKVSFVLEFTFFFFFPANCLWKMIVNLILNDEE